MFCLYVILTISYLRAQTIETSSLPTDSSRPLFKQTEIFSILTVWLYISTVSTVLNIRASYLSASSGFRLQGEIPAGQICDSSKPWLSISDLFDFWWEVLYHFLTIIPRLIPTIQTRCHCLRLKDVLMIQASSYSTGKRTFQFQWMLLNNILWMAPDHQAVYVGDKYALSLSLLNTCTV